MAQVAPDIDGYFASLSGISKNILSVHNNLEYSYGDRWPEFTTEEQEELLDQYHMRGATPGIELEELPEVFPKLKINCGEKIIVDFENDDGWTWRDEHSGPFSWMSRSQQDLSMADLGDVADGAEDKAKKPSRPPRRHRSPDPNNDSSNKGIWNSPFLSGQNGLPQQDMTAADEIFRKFGIQFGADKDEDDTPSAPISPVHEESKLLVQKEEPVPASPQPSTRSIASQPESVVALHNIESEIDGNAQYFESLNLKPIGAVDDNEVGNQSNEDIYEEYELVNQNDSDSPRAGNDVGASTAVDIEASSVYIEVAGESSTDRQSLSAATLVPLSVDTGSSTSTTDGDNLLDKFELPSVMADSPSDDAAPTGFDFLDNW